jgi:hypothetical protein
MRSWFIVPLATLSLPLVAADPLALTVHTDPATMFTDDPLGNRKAKAGAFAGALCREDASKRRARFS